MNKFKVSSEHVTIKFLLVDGKKLTRSIYNQIQSKRFFDKELNFIGDQVLGFVRDKTDKVLIWSEKGMLRKTNLTPYFKLRESSRYPSAENTEWSFLLADIKYSLSDDADFSEIVQNLAEYDQKIETVRLFLAQVTDELQIFI